MPGTAVPEPPKRKRSGLVLGILALVVVALLAGVAAYLVASRGDHGGLHATVDRCAIDADGALTAAGRLTNDGDATQAHLTVVFDDSKSGKRVDGASVSVPVAGSGASAWNVTGTAGESVQRVTCVVTELSAG
jgi:hypothetical protein